MTQSKTLLMTPKHYGFTIVELLVVIVVISILATITIVSYTGISSKANIAVVQSDLSNSSKKLKMYQTIYGSYPTIDPATKCPIAPSTVDNNYCLKASPNNTYTYTSDGTTFNLVETNVNGKSYNVTNGTTVAVYDPWGANWYDGVGGLTGKHVYKTDASGTYSWNASSPGFTAGCATGGRWPTLTELQAMYTDRASYGTFQAELVLYWSSTEEYYGSTAYYMHLNYGGVYTNFNTNLYAVRCVAD